MNTWIKNDMMGRKLLTEAPENCGFEESMIASVSEEGLLVPSVIFEDGRRCLAYDITGLTDLKEALAERLLSEGELTALLLQVNRALENLQRYLLTEQNLLMTCDRIYLRPEESKLLFCVHPAVSEDFRESFRVLLRYAAVRTDRADTGAMRLILDLLQQTEKEDFSFCDLLAILQANRGNPETIGSRAAGMWGPEVLRTEPDRSREEHRAAEAAPADPDLRTEGAASRGQDRTAGIPGPAKGRSRKKGRIPKAKPRAQSREGSGGWQEALLRFGITQFIMAAGLLAVFFLKGRRVMLRMLPLYLILCGCIALYFLIPLLYLKITGASGSRREEEGTGELPLPEDVWEQNAAEPWYS